MYLSKNKVSFGAGWNAKVANKIKKCDIKQVVKKMQALGIEEVDFHGNKELAWCCYRVAKIFNKLNKKYKLNLGLPRAILVEDFSKLKTTKQTAHSFCNMYPVYLIEGSDKVVKERTLLFNSFSKQLEHTPEHEKWLYQWKNIDAISEDLYKNGALSSNHFLNLIIHEFSHAAHDKHLLKKHRVDGNHPKRAEKFLAKLRKQTSLEYCVEFARKFGDALSEICTYATFDQFEAIAYDMAQMIDRTMDSTKFYPTQNPFKSSSYPKSNVFLTVRSFFKPKSKNELKRTTTA